MKHLIIPFILFSCVPKSSQEVKVAGNLRQLMMDNVTSSNIDLNKLKPYTHLYAIGAVEGLKGEISIVDGVPLITKIENNAISNESTFNVNATLLVYTQVERFRTVNVSEELDLQTLEDYLGEVADSRDLTSPFAFRIKGTAATIRWHIINGPSKKHDDHAASAFSKSVSDTEVELLGFYSRQHQGVFTHHGSSTHIHLVNLESGMTAHVDEVVLKGGSKLLIPAKP